MIVRWLGWAGVEVEMEGSSVVIDPLADPRATFAALGERASAVELPAVMAPRSAGAAVAGLVSHLHRDHTDAAALAAALAPDAIVHEPGWPGGADVENLALAQANVELEREGLRRAEVEAWQARRGRAVRAHGAAGGRRPRRPAGLVAGRGRRIGASLHLGDTAFHGFWWRIARRHGPFDVVFAPINGAVVDFPHLQPPSPSAATMEPEQAALAGELLGARIVVPIHYGGLAIEPWYRPIDDAAERFAAAAAGRPYEVRILEPGESFELESAAGARAER